jgi:urease accessory protein
MHHRIPRIGVGGPVGSGKTTLIEALVPMLLAASHAPLVITNDIVTREGQEYACRTLAGVFDPAHPGRRNRRLPIYRRGDDPTMHLATAAELER